MVPTVMITRESGATDLQEEREVSQGLEDLESDGDEQETNEVGQVATCPRCANTTRRLSVDPGVSGSRLPSRRMCWASRSMSSNLTQPTRAR